MHTFRLRAFLCDAPARAFLKNIKGHNAVQGFATSILLESDDAKRQAYLPYAKELMQRFVTNDDAERTSHSKLQDLSSSSDDEAGASAMKEGPKGPVPKKTPVRRSPRKKVSQKPAANMPLETPVKKKLPKTAGKS
ncbi:hypothetical protein SKAU_G00212330 [Synaphobranchus kaupii]|uniref:Uncharacterized protein n=1 Tax=Synaphobranchus kaupii TaxID=118154 RepID=A0A9Q1F944_SYNKA|nr:hypothetical protein SKAU_G00212330 [Synaphobranchus kaupii]